MNPPANEILRRLGAGQSLAAVCSEARLSPEEFDSWWRETLAGRLPPSRGVCRCRVRQRVHVHRDSLGIPHVYAGNNDDLFFGLGYAMAQDRLFQLDFLRRKGSGRLAEVLGPESGQLDFLVRMVGVPSVLDWDRLARTVGLRRIAEQEWTTLPEETRQVLTAFTAGVNAHLEEAKDNLPIEFALLDYQPEPWSPIDSLTIEVDFRWYLTGRFPVIVNPEIGRRVLGDGPLWRAFLQAEFDGESILQPGEYSSGVAASVGRPSQAVQTAWEGRATGGGGADDSGGGSNNWVVSGKLARDGRPLLASDPHVPFDAVSWWYEVHLCGGSYHVAGMAYAGMPAVMFGRNERVAWGCTNNICSQRDLYQEKTDPSHPGCFLHDGRWEPAKQREEVIAVRGSAPVRLTVRESRNGPLVDAVLPPPARNTGPVSLKWLGASAGGWLTALLRMNRAGSADELREATRPWQVPTFSVVHADVEGHFGYQAVGGIPLRSVWERGYRPGWEPAHQWRGLIPFEGMPQVFDPERGWVATANNRPAPDDFPYPLSGNWADGGNRAHRIHQMMPTAFPGTLERFGVMQRDTLSARAERGLPGLLEALAEGASPVLCEVMRFLRAWDCRLEPDRVGATLFEAFYVRWVKRVLRQRFDSAGVGLLAWTTAGLATSLLGGDPAGWFAGSDRRSAIQETMSEAVDYLVSRLGPDMSEWTWGRLHLLPLRHVLSGRGDLGRLLDQHGGPVAGCAVTVLNTTPGAELEARMGASYRMLADLGSSPPVLWASDSQSQSGQPGSPHYGDQLRSWLRGDYHALTLERPADPAVGENVRTLEPGNEER